MDFPPLAEIGRHAGNRPEHHCAWNHLVVCGDTPGVAFSSKEKPSVDSQTQNRKLLETQSEILYNQGL